MPFYKNKYLRTPWRKSNSASLDSSSQLRRINTFLAFATKIRGLLIEVDRLLKDKMNNVMQIKW